MEIILVTGNERKVGEARLACKEFGIKVTQRSIQIDEIQSNNPVKISEHKARSAYEVVRDSLVVTDTFWNIPALKGFPGAYMKDVAEWFSEQDFLNLLADKTDKRISFSENITYYNGKNLKVFAKEFWGRIVDPRGDGASIENIAEFDGKTLGERRQEGGFSHKVEDFVWHDFCKWYTKDAHNLA